MTGVGKPKGTFLMVFTKYILHFFKIFGFLLLITQSMINAALAQSCSNSSSDQPLELALEASPTQRVGDELTLRHDRLLNHPLNHPPHESERQMKNSAIDKLFQFLFFMSCLIF